MTRVVAIITTLLAAVLALSLTTALRTQDGTVRLVTPQRAAAPSATTPAGLPVRSLPDHVTGMVSNDLAAFDAKCACRPNLAVHYARWNENPDTSRKLAAGMSAAGAAPMLEVSPTGISLSAVAAGRGDKWLLAYASMIRSLRTQVLLSFAPEANGHWYTWGWPNVRPQAEVAAWRHVVTVFRRAGVTNARWIWITNQLWRGSGPLPRLWPGAGYVDEIGIDGYFRSPGDTFASVFGGTINTVRGFAPQEPVLITETGASPQAGKARAVAAIAAGVRAHRLKGFVWFDINQGNGGPSHSDWSLENEPGALAAFAKEVPGTS